MFDALLQLYAAAEHALHQNALPMPIAQPANTALATTHAQANAQTATSHAQTALNAMTTTQTQTTVVRTLLHANHTAKTSRLPAAA